MAIDITIQGTVINFPESGEAPNWAEAIVDFAQAVESALSGIVGSFDVSSQNFIIDAYNGVSNQNIPALQFPTSQVRGAFVRYTVARDTTTTSAYEAGNIMIVYNPDNISSNKWEITRDYVGNGQITFNVTDTGQFQFSTTTLGGLNHTGKIAFVAQALLQE